FRGAAPHRFGYFAFLATDSADHHDDRILAMRGRMSAISVRRNIRSVGKQPHGNSCGHLVGARIEDPDETPLRTNAEDLGPGKMLAHPRETWPYGNVSYSFQLDEVHDGHRAIGGRHVGA